MHQNCLTQKINQEKKIVQKDNGQIAKINQEIYDQQQKLISENKENYSQNSLNQQTLEGTVNIATFLKANNSCKNQSSNRENQNQNMKEIFEQQQIVIDAENNQQSQQYCEFHPDKKAKYFINQFGNQRKFCSKCAINYAVNQNGIELETIQQQQQQQQQQYQSTNEPIEQKIKEQKSPVQIPVEQTYQNEKEIETDRRKQILENFVSSIMELREFNQEKSVLCQQKIERLLQNSNDLTNQINLEFIKASRLLDNQKNKLLASTKLKQIQTLKMIQVYNDNLEKNEQELAGMIDDFKKNYEAIINEIQTDPFNIIISRYQNQANEIARQLTTYSNTRDSLEFHQLKSITEDLISQLFILQTTYETIFGNDIKSVEEVVTSPIISNKESLVLQNHNNEHPEFYQQNQDNDIEQQISQLVSLSFADQNPDTFGGQKPGEIEEEQWQLCDPNKQEQILSPCQSPKTMQASSTQENILQTQKREAQFKSTLIQQLENRMSLKNLQIQNLSTRNLSNYKPLNMNNSTKNINFIGTHSTQNSLNQNFFTQSLSNFNQSINSNNKPKKNANLGQKVSASKLVKSSSKTSLQKQSQQFIKKQHQDSSVYNNILSNLQKNQNQKTNSKPTGKEKSNNLQNRYLRFIQCN